MDTPKEKNQENRYRRNQIHLRLSDEEYAYLQKKFKKSECHTVNDFFITLLKKSNIYKMNWKDFNIPAVSGEISKIGRNVNQIRKKLNETGSFYESDMEEIQKGFHRIWQLLESILSKLRSNVQ